MNANNYKTNNQIYIGIQRVFALPRVEIKTLTKFLPYCSIVEIRLSMHLDAFRN